MIDTSAVLAVLLEEPTRPRVLEATRGASLCSAPTLPWELGNALSALFRRGKIAPVQAHAVWTSFERVPVRLVDVSMSDALGLAHAEDIYAYDAYMLECAGRLRLPLLTLDVAQREVARRLTIEVIEV